MAIIDCPECTHKISDQSVSCPKCGFINNKKDSLVKESQVIQTQEKMPILEYIYRLILIMVIFIVILIVLSFLFFLMT